MKHDNRDAIDFANEPVGRLFRRMIAPTLISMVSMVILNLTDGAFIGHGAGSDALAAINIAAPIFNLLAGVGIMFGIGCSVVASIHLAQGKNKAASINITQATMFTLLRGFVLVIPTFIILPELIGNIGMWLAIPVAELITLLLISITTISKKRINQFS